MLKLRTILLHDYIYYILLSITVLITIINILIPRQSIYNENIKRIDDKIKEKMNFCSKVCSLYFLC